MDDYSYDPTPWKNIQANIKNVVINEGITSIGERAFYGCENLTTITIPNSVTAIGYAAFYGCTSLVSVTIPNSVTSIGEVAFYFCTSLSSVTIPNSVTAIGSSAFYNCTSLASVTIPNSVTYIGDEAFYGCTSLASVTIPNSVTYIGEEAFVNCQSLTSVTIPNSVTSIGYNAFYWVPVIINYSSLTDDEHWGARSENGVVDGDFIYEDNTKTNLLVYIGEGGEITIPNSVTTIGKKAFFECTSLTSVTIPNSVITIGSSAFAYCKSLASVTIPNSVTSIEMFAFAGCEKLTSVTIPNSVTYIGEEAFFYCPSLTSVTIPNSVTTIGGCAFSKCTSLASVTIPNSVTTIGSCAFSECTSLASVTIPNSVTTIGNSAFNDCTSLENVYLYANHDNLTWISNSDEFIKDPEKGTNCHVFADYLDKYEEKFNHVNVTFVGDVKLMSDKNITIAAQTYSGSTLTPVVKDGEKTLIEDEDYTITFPEGGCINVGDYTITLTGKNPLYYQSAEITFTINVKELVASNVADIAAQVYTGSAIEPEITVSDGEKTLVKGTDYLVTYADNTNVGTAKAIITGIGNYSGIIEKTFTINTSPKTATDDIAINSNIKIWAFENTIFVENASKEIVIVDMSGRIVKTINPVSDRTEVNVSKSGVYIVKTGTKTQKVSL